MSGEYKALAILGAGKQIESDVQHVFTALDFAIRAGEEVDINSVWVSPPLVVKGIVESLPLNKDTARDLVEIDLRRFELPDELLNQRERELRDTLQEVPEADIEAMKDAFASVLCRLGGVAVYEGTLTGVSMAAGYYQDLRQLGR